MHASVGSAAVRCLLLRCGTLGHVLAPLRKAHAHWHATPPRQSASLQQPAARRPHVTALLPLTTPPSPIPCHPQDAAPWWTKITLTQVVIVLSFTTIIGLMISTFFFVLSTGAIHFNE